MTLTLAIETMGLTRHFGRLCAVDSAGARVDGLADFLRRVWALGPAGVSVPVTVERGGAAVRLVVASADREDFLRKPSLQ